MKVPLTIICLIISLTVAPLSYAGLTHCYGSRQVDSCDQQLGYQDCVNYYEGSGCMAVNCLPGSYHRCRSTHTPKAIYCVERFHSLKYCEVRPDVHESSHPRDPGSHP